MHVCNARKSEVEHVAKLICFFCSSCLLLRDRYKWTSVATDIHFKQGALSTFLWSQGHAPLCPVWEVHLWQLKSTENRKSSLSILGYILPTGSLQAHVIAVLRGIALVCLPSASSVCGLQVMQGMLKEIHFQERMKRNEEGAEASSLATCIALPKWQQHTSPPLTCPCFFCCRSIHRQNSIKHVQVSPKRQRACNTMTIT